MNVLKTFTFLNWLSLRKDLYVNRSLAKGTYDPRLIFKLLYFFNLFLLFSSLYIMHYIFISCIIFSESKLMYILKSIVGNSLAVQWLGLCISTVVSTGSIPGQGSKILHAMQHGQKKKIQV